MIDLSGAAALARRLGLTPLTPAPQGVGIGDADLLDDYEERAAIMEFDGGLPRQEAEARAWQEVFGSEQYGQSDQE
ncbi:hypothetical protein [Pedomonas mirosovicensis]|uniref:hypothetical protein n=1 Tax=Pedomonas mirosovicensis TaxID=2908641 RepID=UPI00216A1D37|nr:hypothetical protein [Pedomonas mirosovicensis]MCH8683885.1 hypothetical protein [Pedomonas mirosovicensis]